MPPKGNPEKNQTNQQRPMKKMMKTWILNPHLKVEDKNHNGPTTGGIELQLRAAIPLTEAGAGGGHPWMTWTMSLPLNVK